MQKALKVVMVLWPKENEPFALSHSRWFYKYAILFCCCAKFSTEKPQVNSFENFNSWSGFKAALEAPKRHGLQSDLWANIKPQRMYNLNHFGEILFTTFDKIEGRYDSIQASLRPNNNQIDLSFAQTMLRGMYDIRKEERNKLNITQKNLPSFLGRKIHNFAA
ncbi:MAG: hypothetical protein IT560_03530 [Alphaproteobacteria bacterium]|nr:hypothetical protein [Alphaproteobacteria bacterium]